jgi:hypothetical protein
MFIAQQVKARFQTRSGTFSGVMGFKDIPNFISITIQDELLGSPNAYSIEPKLPASKAKC